MPKSIAPRSAASTSSGSTTRAGGGFCSSRCSAGQQLGEHFLALPQTGHQQHLIRGQLLQLRLAGLDGRFLLLDLGRYLDQPAGDLVLLAHGRGHFGGNPVLLRLRSLELLFDGFQLLRIGCGSLGGGKRRQKKTGGQHCRTQT